MKFRVRRGLAAVITTAGLLTATACGGGGDTGSGTSSEGAAGSCQPAPAGTKVELSFSSWVPGMQKTVDLWNSQNPDIQVKYKQVVGGNAGTYQSYFNQLKAGNAGDLGMVEFDSLPSFRIQDGLANIGACDPVKTAAPKYVPWTIKQVSFDEPGAVYAIPQDIGPLALYYRKDLFEKAGIPVPTTWDEFYTAAKTIKSEGGFITNFAADAPNLFAGLAWQNGAQWFSNADGKWKVNLADEKTTQVADYWTKMISEGLVDNKPALSNVQYKALDTGKEWTLIGAAWTAKLLETGAPNTSGKWAVAELPQWTPGAHAAGNWGGSTTVVWKNSKHPYEAAKFATWAFGSQEAFALNNKNGGQYPTTVEAQENLPVLKQPSDFYGGQVIWTTFADAAKGVNENWQWGPTMTQTYADLTNGLGAANSGKESVGDALKAAQEKTIATMKSQSLEVE